jgi:hypothetical protein
MASTIPSVSFPVRWSSFITIETRKPRLILARSVPAILGNLPFLLLRCGTVRKEIAKGSHELVSRFSSITKCIQSKS